MYLHLHEFAATIQLTQHHEARMNSCDRATRNTIASRYAQRGHRMHARWKLANDPAYAATTDLIADSELPVLDIGCGIGLLGHYLHAVGMKPRYLGVDHDAHKISAAQAAAQQGGLTDSVQWRCDDASVLPPSHGHVVLLDVLHYMSATDQLALLRTAITHLAPNGLLVIRNVLCEAHWRFHATRMEEFFLRISGWIPGGVQHYPTLDELRAPLLAAGLDVCVRPLHGRTPYNSYLIVARRICERTLAADSTFST